MDEVTDWNGVTLSFAWTPSGRRHTIGLGDAVTGAVGFFRDGTVEQLVWTRGNGDVVRSHTGIGYDPGGYRIAESVSVIWPDGTTKAGDAGFDHDLAGRLRSWTSPFQAPLDENAPTTTYGLDDGGNVTAETVTIDGRTISEATSVIVDNRLEQRTTRDEFVAGTSTRQVVVDRDYDEVGLEHTRTTTVSRGVIADPATTLATGHDAAGHVASLDDDASGASDVAFVYDADDRVVARTVTRSDNTTATTLYSTSSAPARSSSTPTATVTRSPGTCSTPTPAPRRAARR